MPAQRSGPDPLVELARLIGQNEGSAAASAYDTIRPGARRRDQPGSDIAEPHTAAAREAVPRAAAPRPAEPRAAEPRAAAPRPAEPRAAEPRAAAPRPAEPPRPTYPPVSERPVGRVAEPEPYSDQRYDGYADPDAPDPDMAQMRRSEPQAWRDTTGPDLADPYHTEAGWRTPRKRAALRQEHGAGPQDSLPQHDYGAAEPAHPAERARMARAAAPALPVQAEARRLAAAPAPAQVAAPVATPRAPTAPALLDDLRQAYGRYAPAADGAYEAGDYYDDRPPARGQNEYGRDAYQGEDGYDYGDAGNEDQSYGGGRRRVWLAFALVALAVIGTGGAYAVRTMLSGSSHSGPPPIIQADTSPKKIAAVHPGDKQIQDRLGDRTETERMVPREEQPLTIRDPNAPGLVPGIRSAEPPMVSAPATTSAANSREEAPESREPKRIRTVTIRPGNDPAEAAPDEGGRSVPAAAPARTVPPAKPAVAPPQAAPAAPAAPRAPTAMAAPPPRTKPGDYMVQLSAQKSEADAKASFRILQSKYASVLGGQELHVKRKDLGSKGIYYGAQVGPFASRSEAAQLCEHLKAAGGSCIVQRN